MRILKWNIFRSSSGDISCLPFQRNLYWQLLDGPFQRNKSQNTRGTLFLLRKTDHGESLNSHNLSFKLLLHWHNKNQSHQKEEGTWAHTRHRLAGALWGSFIQTLCQNRDNKWRNYISSFGKIYISCANWFGHLEDGAEAKDAQKEGYRGYERTLNILKLLVGESYNKVENKRHKGVGKVVSWWKKVLLKTCRPLPEFT